MFIFMKMEKNAQWLNLNKAKILNLIIYTQKKESVLTPIIILSNKSVFQMRKMEIITKSRFVTIKLMKRHTNITTIMKTCKEYSYMYLLMR